MLPEIANGVITYSPDTDAPFNVSTTATYTCNDGYELVDGSMIRTCINTTSGGGEFDGTEPRCRREQLKITIHVCYKSKEETYHV